MNLKHMDTKTKLIELTKGLTFQSETDAPMEVIEWKSGIPKENTEKPLKTLSVAELLKESTKAEKWHGKEEREQVKRFQKLQAFLVEELEGAKAYKSAGVERDIFIIGKNKEGAWLGIKSKLVET